jgi:hypothetical protein
MLAYDTNTIPVREFFRFVKDWIVFMGWLLDIIHTNLKTQEVQISYFTHKNNL